mmetsp:Transcript_12369/g.22480  ORF Transcript_12369/g.22480 Transcript_12369/m.22480 type:complete len:91 (-) Transcript_12369:306-578(-)
MRRAINTIVRKAATGQQVRHVSGKTDMKVAMRSLQAQAYKSLTLAKFAPWGLPAAMIGGWMIYPALGEEKQANFRFLMTLGIAGKSPFSS